MKELNKIEKEKRFFDPSLSIREDSKAKKKYLIGYAARFDQPSKLISEGGKTFIEYIKRGAFDEVLNEEGLDVVLVVNHDKKDLLARTSSGTLTLETDEKGLRYEALLPTTTLGRDVEEMVQRGDYKENSFHFGARKQDILWQYDQQEQIWKRYVQKVAILDDVSLVTRGAYANTDVEVAERQLQEQVEADNSYQLEIDKMKLKLYSL